MINWLVFSTFIISLTMSLIGLVADLTYQFHYVPLLEHHQQKIDDRMTSWLEDETYFSNHQVFNPPTEGKANFQTLVDDMKLFDENVEVVPAAHRKDVLSRGRQWLKDKHKTFINPEIVELFDRVEDFDHWNCLRTPSTRFTKDLVVASQIYLAHTYHQTPSAIHNSLKKIRHLSRILMTTEILNLKRAALSLLEKEEIFLDFIADNMRYSRLLWSPIQPNELKRFRDYLNSTEALLSPLTPAPTIDKAFLTEKGPVALCALYQQRYPALTWSRQFLQPRLLFEPNFNEGLESLTKVEEKYRTQCQVSLPDQANNDWVSRIPYYRRLYVLEFMFKDMKKKDNL